MLAVMCLFVSGSLCASPTAHAQEAPRGACEFLTQAQVGAALGIPFDPDQQRPGSAGTTQCTWRSTNKEYGVGLATLDENQFRGSMHSDMRMSATPASGIADEAHFRESNVKMGNFFVILYVRKGTTMFDVSITGRTLTASQMKQTEVALAQAALSAGQ